MLDQNRHFFQINHDKDQNFAFLSSRHLSHFYLEILGRINSGPKSGPQGHIFSWQPSRSIILMVYTLTLKSYLLICVEYIHCIRIKCLSNQRKSIVCCPHKKLTRREEVENFHFLTLEVSEEIHFVSIGSRLIEKYFFLVELKPYTFLHW